MRILLTSTSFIDTPGNHQSLLNEKNYKIDRLRGPLTKDTLLPIIHKYDGLICGDDEIDKEVLKAASLGKLKVISKYGIGLDKIDLNAAKTFGIMVKNTPGVNHVAVSEHILALIFNYYKNIFREISYTKDGVWKRLIGHEIDGKKVGIVGLGRIGKELAIKSKHLGLKIKVYDPVLDNSFVKKYNIEVSPNLESLVENIDVLCLTLPLNENTKGIINKKLLHKSDGLVIVNTSRALIVDQPSLIELLKNNKIKAYLTDVLEKEPMVSNHPLLEYENVFITPHIGSRTYESVQRQGIMAVENLENELNKI